MRQRDERSGVQALAGVWRSGGFSALSIGDPVVVGLKDYRLLPHYPLRAESGAKMLGE